MNRRLTVSTALAAAIWAAMTLVTTPPARADGPASGASAHAAQQSSSSTDETQDGEGPRTRRDRRTGSTAGDRGDGDALAASDGSPASDDSSFFGPKHRQQLYRKGRLHYSRAALLTLALPGLGNFYAEQYLLGGLSVTLMGFAAVLVSYGFATQQTEFSWIGAGTAGAAYTTGLITTYFGIRRYNHKLRRRLRLTDALDPDAAPSAPAIGPALGFRF